jgi:hypothetical protein
MYFYTLILGTLWAKVALCFDMQQTILLRSVRRLLVTVNAPTTPIFVILMMDELRSSKISIPTRTTQRNIPEYGTIHSYCREKLKSYILLAGWAL